MIEFLKGLTQLHNLFYSVLWFMVILTVLVFVHEFGHYIIARWNRVRIELSTHDAGGLSELDVKLAEAMDKFAG